MLRVSMHQAAPGMKLALPIHHPDQTSRMLLRASFELDRTAIQRLEEMGFHEIWIEYPTLEFVGKYINPTILRRQAELGDTIGHAFDCVGEETGANLDYQSFKQSLSQLLDALLDDPKAAIFINDMVSTNKPLLRHTSKVCFLSLLMGLKLDGYLMSQRTRIHPRHASNVTSLGVGAILHDIGLMGLDKETLDHRNKTYDDTDPKWRQHVRIGYEMIKGQVEPSAAAVVLHHHQCFDGTGFPRKKNYEGELHGLKGAKIHIFARVTATANTFDRLHHPANGTDPIPVVSALRAMQEHDIARTLDPVTYAALLSVLPPYAPGTQVTLSTGEQGVVTSWTPHDPCRPCVQVLLGDITSTPNDDNVGPLYDLCLRRDIAVVELEGKRVKRDNFYPDDAGLLRFGATNISLGRVRHAA